MFEKVASILGSAVDAHFPPEVRVIAEPGRFFVDSAFTLCANVIGRRTVTNADNKLHYMYYLNDGVYGAFSSITFKRHFSGPAILFKDSKFFIGEQVEEEGYECSIWGPTCDSKDCLYKSIKLPLLEPGDWLYFENMGAYTSCISCPFNGFEKAKVFYTNTFSLVNYLNMCLVY
jgi:ornithine decarboxylase